jgi:CCR4-NOT transcriptional regulation complex NOT5 subunit
MSGKQVDNHVAKPESDHAKPEANHVVEPKVALAGQEEKKSDNKEERGAEPSTVTPIVNDPPRSFIPKAPYPKRLKAPKKNAQFAEILEVFKQVLIDIPFFYAI